MAEIRADHLTRFEGKGVGTKSGQKPISVMLPTSIDEIVRSLPNRSEWIRQAIVEKLQREKQVATEVEPAAEQEIAPTPHKRQRVSSLKQADVLAVKAAAAPKNSKTTDELKPETFVKNPAGWRGWVDKALGNGQYAVTFENGLTDEYPGHLLTVEAEPAAVVPVKVSRGRFYLQLSYTSRGRMHRLYWDGSELLPKSYYLREKAKIYQSKTGALAAAKRLQRHVENYAARVHQPGELLKLVPVRVTW